VSDKYILDSEGVPILEPDLMIWAMWFEKANRVVKQETIGPSKVSTIFLGLDHNYLPDGEPIFWETMVFGGKLDGHTDRCPGFKADALEMHERVAGKVRKAQGL